MATPSKPSSIASLEPALVWRFFQGIAAVPRPSKHEEQIRRHMRVVAEEHGLALREDAVGNIVIEVPASKGHAGAPITVLQGHLDMVCEQNAGTRHDFEHEGIRLQLGKDEQTGEPIVQADGTTLGADNGLGVAMGLAAACDPAVVHGPLELLFTVDEEAGMTGAKALAPDFFQGRRMLNLDSEEDDAIYIGCAGGCDTNLTWEFPLETLPVGTEVCRVSAAGLCGGHSGGDIHLNRGNAIKLLVRTLWGAKVEGMRLVEARAGSQRNAIPREGSMVVAGPTGLATALRAAAERVQAQAAAECAEDTPRIEVEPLGEAASRAVSPADTRRWWWALMGVPHGVAGMHVRIPGLVETSNNLATVTVTPDEAGEKLRVTVGALTRSSSASRMEEVLQQVAAVGHLAGARVDTDNPYPGWEPNVDSPLLGVCRRVYEEQFAEPPNVAAIHAGLECGIIAERVGRLDAVSIGPRITGAHSPDERTYVLSVQKAWRFLVALLAELAKT